MLYRQTVFNLICLFGLFSIITMPLMQTYTSVENQGILQKQNAPYSRKSLANIGYTSVQCALSPISFEQLFLSCPYGEISNITENGLGLNLEFGT